MSPKRVIWIAAIAALLYIGFAVFIFTNFELPEMSPSALSLVALAAIVQIGAKWFFGMLFRESVRESGGELRRFSAFKGALVGAGVARLIPPAGRSQPLRCRGR